MVSSSGFGFNFEQKKVFNQLLYIDAIRGEDSTGVFGVNRYGNVDFLKDVGSSGVFMETPEYKKFESDIFSNYRMVVGHNRKATRGTVTDVNAHPFVEGNHILVHNGTLTNHKDLTEQDVEVDSHAILHSIVERGYSETLKEIQGAFALIFYNAVDKELNLIRNNERPLAIANCHGAWYFASESNMLEFVLDRENIKIHDLTYCKPGMMYSFRLSDEKNMFMTPYKLYSPPKAPAGFIQGVVQQTLLPPPKTNEQESNEEKTGDEKNVYAVENFKIGSRVLVQGNNVFPVKKMVGKYDNLFYGEWYFDPSVIVKTWCNEDDLAAFDEELDEDNIVFSAKIDTIIRRNQRIILICNDMEPYQPKYDSSKQEIFEDEFMFTDKKCQWCNKDMSFTEVEAGEFSYKSADDYYLICEHCLDKGAQFVL